MLRSSRSLRIFLLVCLLLGASRPAFVYAVEAPVPAADADPDQTSLKDQIDEIQAQVRAKEQSVKALDATIAQYQERARSQANAALTLKNQLNQLEEAISAQQVKIRRTQEMASLLDLQIKQTAQQVAKDASVLRLRQIMLEEALSELDQADQTSGFVSFFERPSFSSYLADREEIQSLQRALFTATEEVHVAKADHEKAQQELEKKRADAEVQRLSLQAEKDHLEEDRQAKQSLITQTQNKESEFQRVVAELRAQQQAEASVIAQLQERLKDKLNSSDETLARGDILLQWPIQPKRGISAQFHDQSYPFRNLFEHPGIDLPTPVGTPVRAAAGGYVAWNRTGTQYGNYIMVIHPSGIATVYAHLSGFVAKPDTYVERGEIIGYSGGRPGDQGAGLSTGAHLHFEVRQNGIPVNPENFLPEL